MTRQQVDYIEEPRFAQLAFGSPRYAWLWLVARVWLGWQFLHAGWGKVFGGDITWKLWDLGRGTHHLTGASSIGWTRSGFAADSTGKLVHYGVGGKLAQSMHGVVSPATGTKPTTYGWYSDFLRWVEHTGHPFVGPLIAYGELLAGIGLIIGAFVGVAAFSGLLMNFTYILAGKLAIIAPPMILAGVLLVLAWRTAGWYGADRWLLRELGTPWHKGDRFANHPQREPMPPPRVPAGV